MSGYTKSLVGYCCFKPPKDKTSSPPSPYVRRRTPIDPVPLNTKTGLISKPPTPPTPPRIPDPIPSTPSRDEDESFRIPGPKTWEIPRDSPPVVRGDEDMGKYMKRCLDCLERKGEVILGCGHGVCEMCFERGGRNERCVGCRAMWRL